MATSGTVQTTVVRTQAVIDTAYRRCKIPAGQITSEMQEIGKLQLYTMLSALPNQGRLLWTIQRPLFGVRPGSQQYTMPQGSLDFDQLLWRVPTPQSGGTAASSAGGTAANAFDSDLDTVCTQTSTNGNISYDFGTDVTVCLVGVCSNGDQTWTLTFETSDDGVTWTSVLAPGAADYEDDVFTWYDVLTAKPAQYFRCRVSGGETLDVRELRFCTDYTQTQLARANQDTYSLLTNPVQGNQPNQFFVIREASDVQFYLWPVPSENEVFNVLAGWSRRYIEDVGQLYQELELPSRWLDAVMWDLAWRVSLELPPEVKPLDGNYQAFLGNISRTKLNEALNEERDNSPIYFSPNISVYTA